MKFGFLKLSLKLFLADSLYGWIFKLSFLMVFIQSVLTGFLYSKIPPQVPLYYSRPWGEDQLVEKINLFLLPLSILFFTCLNLFLTALCWEKQKLIAQIAVFLTAVMVFLLTFVFIEIFFLVVF